jgi:transcriptional regulator of acetoin/glycerol metabolism
MPRKGPVRKLEVRTVRAALKKAGGNKSRAARLLGVGRATLYRFLNAHPEALSPE